MTASDTRVHRGGHAHGAFADERRNLIRSSMEVGPSDSGPVPATAPARTTAADRSVTGPDHGRPVQAWPLLVLAAPAAVAVWSGVGWHRHNDRIRADPPAAGYLGFPASEHSHHAAHRRRGLRGVRITGLAGLGLTGEPQDPAVREVVCHRVAAARHGWAGRLSSAHRSGGPARTVGHHHGGVLPAGPGPGHGDRANTHGSVRRPCRRTRTTWPRTDLPTISRIGPPDRGNGDNNADQSAGGGSRPGTVTSLRPPGQLRANWTVPVSECPAGLCEARGCAGRTPPWVRWPGSSPLNSLSVTEHDPGVPGKAPANLARHIPRSCPAGQDPYQILRRLNKCYPDPWITNGSGERPDTYTACRRREDCSRDVCGG